MRRLKESLSVSSEDVRSHDNMPEGLSGPLLLRILGNDGPVTTIGVVQCSH